LHFPLDLSQHFQVIGQVYANHELLDGLDFHRHHCR
jgi:hypothetical protein